MAEVSESTGALQPWRGTKAEAARLFIDLLEPGGEGYIDLSDVTVYASGGAVVIEHEQMHENLTVNFESMSAISKAFGTMKIDLDQHAIGGCETCDYGSRYTTEVWLRGGVELVD